MLMVPTNNHLFFDGTQTTLDPLKLGATYLGKALVWVAGCLAIATVAEKRDFIPNGYFLSGTYKYNPQPAK